MKENKPVLTNDVIENMTIQDLKKIDDKRRKALLFALIAHGGQVRKATPDILYSSHPISVANILEKYSNDINLVVSGYLHDIVEMTEYNLNDIEDIFDSDVRQLVDSATYIKDETLSWEERKKKAIDRVRNLDFRNKLLIAADKTNNIECLLNHFNIIGYNDFSAFNSGEEQQEWYYRNMYMSIINNEDKNHHLFKRLEKGINNVFGRSMEEYFFGIQKTIKY